MDSWLELFISQNGFLTCVITHDRLNERAMQPVIICPNDKLNHIYLKILHSTDEKITPVLGHSSISTGTLSIIWLRSIILQNLSCYEKGPKIEMNWVRNSRTKAKSSHRPARSFNLSREPQGKYYLRWKHNHWRLGLRKKTGPRWLQSNSRKGINSLHLEKGSSIESHRPQWRYRLRWLSFCKSIEKMRNTRWGSSRHLKWKRKNAWLFARSCRWHMILDYSVCLCEFAILVMVQQIRLLFDEQKIFNYDSKNVCFTHWKISGPPRLNLLTRHRQCHTMESTVKRNLNRRPSCFLCMSSVLAFVSLRRPGLDSISVSDCLQLTDQNPTGDYTPTHRNPFCCNVCTGKLNLKYPARNELWMSGRFFIQIIFL